MSSASSTRHTPERRSLTGAPGLECAGDPSVLGVHARLAMLAAACVAALVVPARPASAAVTPPSAVRSLQVGTVAATTVDLSWWPANAGTNPVGALTGLHHGAASFFPPTGELFSALIDEGLAVAKALRIELHNDPKQMVMAVRFGSDARAYPIRAMAYHHLVNDVLAGTPIVVTY